MPTRENLTGHIYRGSDFNSSEDYLLEAKLPEYPESFCKIIFKGEEGERRSADEYTIDDSWSMYYLYKYCANRYVRLINKEIFVCRVISLHIF